MQKNHDQNVDFYTAYRQDIFREFNEAAGIKYHLSLSPSLLPVALIILLHEGAIWYDGIRLLIKQNDADVHVYYALCLVTPMIK